MQAYTRQKRQPNDDIREDITRLIAENRQRCLWFLAGDLDLSSTDALLMILRYLERYGDRSVYIEARHLAQSIRDVRS